MADEAAHGCPVLLQPDPQKKAAFAEIHRFARVDAHDPQHSCFILQIRPTPKQDGEGCLTARHVFADSGLFGDAQATCANGTSVCPPALSLEASSSPTYCSMKGCVFTVTSLCFLCILNWRKVRLRGEPEKAVLSLAMAVLLIPREA